MDKITNMDRLQLATRIVDVARGAPDEYVTERTRFWLQEGYYFGEALRTALIEFVVRVAFPPEEVAQ